MIDVFVSGLSQIAFGFQIVVFRFVEFGDGGFPVLIFCRHQQEGIFAAAYNLTAAVVFGKCRRGVVVYLLYLFVECLAGVVKLQLLRFTVYFGTADIVACLQTVEERYVEIKTDVLAEVVLKLLGECCDRIAGSLVVVGSKTGAE